MARPSRREPTVAPRRRHDDGPHFAGGPGPAASLAAAKLGDCGGTARDINVFAVYRCNWEVMVRGLFTNKSTNNRLAPNLSPGHAIHASSGRVLPLWQAAAEVYARESRATVIIAAIENSGEIATLRAGGLISAIIGDIHDSDAAGIGRVSDVP